MPIPILTVALTHEPDIVTARRRARQIAKLMNFADQDGTRISTAVSEIARNAYAYAGGGRVEFLVDSDAAAAALVICVNDRGPGIADIPSILSGRYRSSTGMGLGIVGARRLMDGFEMRSAPGEGASVTLRKNLPAGSPAIGVREVHAIVARLAQQQPHDLYEEVRQQNQDLIGTLDQLRRREEELTRLNRELEDTNRGVVALYAELDQRAEQLRYADQMKTRFLSHMSHELRTPLNSIIGLTRLLLKREPIAHNETASREIVFVQQAAGALTEMVNDLLDLAKAESGKLVVDVCDFDVSTLFGTLRVMMRPLAVNEAVSLVFDDRTSVPALRTDENKVSQILRNFLSNALKFTERGEVRIGASYDAEPGMIRFSVRDTGIGIAPENLSRIFEEFTQIANPLQRSVKGTGLGLPLCKRLAELLGGSVEVESTPGAGSTFIALIPRVFGEKPAPLNSPTHRRRLLLIDDEEVSRYLVRELLGSSYEIIEAASGSDGLALVGTRRPDAILLDLNMPGMSGFQVIERLRAAPETSAIPVVVITSQKLDSVTRAGLSRDTAAILSKDDLARAEALSLDFGAELSVRIQYPGSSSAAEGAT